jgi:hypothetical protein
MSVNCQHDSFNAEVDINRLPLEEGGPVERWQADVRITCRQCGSPFRFVGIQAGCNLDGPAVSIDGTEGRFAIAPKDHVLTPLESNAVRGFTVRKVV